MLYLGALRGGGVLKGGGKTFGVTMSFGVATCPDDASTLQALIESADAQLYVAKRGGRNQVATTNRVLAAA